MALALDACYLSWLTPLHTHAHAGDLRAALYKEVDSFVAALGSRDFLGGSAPNLADLSAFGVLRAVAGTPTYNDVVLNTKVRPSVQLRGGKGWRLQDNGPAVPACACSAH